MTLLLPLKPLRAKRASTLLAIALRDFKKAYTRPDVRIKMSSYAERFDDSCTVCLAGACLLSKSGFKDFKESHGSLSPFRQLDPELRNQMYAINYLRIGEVRLAVEVLGGTFDRGGHLPGKVEMTPWEDTVPGRRRFYAYINRLVKLLKKHGV